MGNLFLKKARKKGTELWAGSCLASAPLGSIPPHYRKPRTPHIPLALLWPPPNKARAPVWQGGGLQRWARIRGLSPESWKVRGASAGSGGRSGQGWTTLREMLSDRDGNAPQRRLVARRGSGASWVTGKVSSAGFGFND